MAQTLRLKRSSVPGRVPTTATLQTGEIAINTADGLVYIRKDDDSIIPLIGANTTVTGSVVLLGSIEATSFTGSFSGSFTGPIVGTLSRTVGSGDGIVSFVFDGSENVTVALDTGSDHFVNAVDALISASKTPLSPQDTIGPGGIDVEFDPATGQISASIATPFVTVGQTLIELGTQAHSVNQLTLTNTEASGAFSGSFSGLIDNAISASHAVNSDLSISASYAAFATNATTASYAQIATSASHAELADNATSASYALTTTSASFSTATVSASHAILADDAISASYAAFATTASYAFYAVSASHAELADDATSASYALFTTTASYALFTTSASYAQTTDIAVSASYATSASHALIANYALNANVETGSLLQTGSIVDATITLTKADGTSFDLVVDNVATASYAAYAANVLNPDTGSFVITGSINDATLTFTKADNTTFDLAVDNVPTASYALYAANVINPNTGSFMTTGSISGATLTFTKADNTTFDITVNGIESASYAATASSADAFLVRNDATVKGDLTVDGTVTAREFHTTFISASIIYESGSNKFGDTADDVHEFTGSILVSGSIDSHDISINDWGSVSASLAVLSGSITNLTLQQVTDSGNSTTLVISASNLNITDFPDVSASLAELYNTSASIASELALVSATASAAYNFTLQDITDNGNSTNLVISASNLNITGFPDVSASLAGILSASTLQGVTDNGNQTTNHISISSSLNVSQSIYSKGEEVLDFAVAMAIALG